MKANNRGDSAVGVIVGLVVVLVLLFGSFSCHITTGTSGFGPTKEIEATIISKHVDISGSGESRTSHFMVTTDKGTFEVQNGWILGMYNADEVYGKLKDGSKFRLTTKGNRVANMWMQQYPYILKADLVK
jgi:hypothetical protein